MLYPGLFPGVTPYRHDGESPVVPGHLACTFRLPAGPCTKEPPDRFDACAIRRLQSFPHVIVLSATRRIRARLSGLSELFLNNCRVVSASLMCCNLGKSNNIVNDKIRKSEQYRRKKSHLYDYEGVIFVCELAATLQIND